MSILTTHAVVTGFLLVTALCLISLALGIAVGKAIAEADRHKPTVVQHVELPDDTQEIALPASIRVWL